jgi:hypothetical protein
MRDLLIGQAKSAALFACGNSFINSRNAITYSDSQFRIAGKAVERGDITDLKLIAENSDLVELAVCYQQITDITPLKALEKLQYLDLSGNYIDDISSVTDLSSLKVLKLCHTNVTELSSILEMPSLEKLYISFDMVKYAESILHGDFDIIINE